MPDLRSNADPAQLLSKIQELTKEHSNSHPYRFFSNPLLTSHITPDIPWLNTPWLKTGRPYRHTGIQKRCACPSRVPGTPTLVIALIPQWFFQSSIMRIFASFLILNNPEQFLEK